MTDLTEASLHRRTKPLGEPDIISWLRCHLPRRLILAIELLHRSIPLHTGHRIGDALGDERQLAANEAVVDDFDAEAVRDAADLQCDRGDGGLV